MKRTFWDSAKDFDHSQHEALDAVYVALTQKKGNWVLDADMKSYFDSMNHAWRMKFLRHRIADRRTLRLMEKILTAGVEEDGKWTRTVVGIPQGAVISPLMANIYHAFFSGLRNSRPCKGSRRPIRF